MKSIVPNVVGSVPGKSSQKWKVVLIDDHPITRQGLRTLINQQPNFEVAGEAADAAQGSDLVARIRPQLAIVDVSLKGPNGIVLTKNITAQLPGLAVLILSMYDESI